MYTYISANIKLELNKTRDMPVMLEVLKNTVIDIKLKTSAHVSDSSH